MVIDTACLRYAAHVMNDFRKIGQIEAYTSTDYIPELTACVNDNGWDTSHADWLLSSRLKADDMIFVFPKASAIPSATSAPTWFLERDLLAHTSSW